MSCFQPAPPLYDRFFEVRGWVFYREESTYRTRLNLSPARAKAKPRDLGVATKIGSSGPTSSGAQQQRFGRWEHPNPLSCSWGHSAT